jgi:hypothetical protein
MEKGFSSFITAFSNKVREPVIGHLILNRSVKNIYWQAFWARSGGLYEPTEAMNNLLNASDVSKDIPIRMIKPPMATMCIIPPVSTWRDPDGFEAVALFAEPSIQSTTGGAVRKLTIFTQRDHACTSMRLLIDDTSDETIAQAVETMVRAPKVEGDATFEEEATRRHLQKTLDYTLKVLLYLSIDGAQLTRETAYSDAPRVFPGLGRKKKDQKLAEVETLYDRYLIGPLALSDELRNSSAGEGSTEVSAHWRRGHFRLQAHGPKASLRKVMFIMPTIVRADRLSD